MPRKEPKEVRIQKQMEVLNCSYEEAAKVVEDDDLIDAGGHCDWEEEMTPEQKKVVRKARQVGRVVGTARAPRKKTEDTDKRQIIDSIKDLLENMGAEVNISNPEREMTLNLNGRDFKITLSAPRAKKAE